VRVQFTTHPQLVFSRPVPLPGCCGIDWAPRRHFWPVPGSLRRPSWRWRPAMLMRVANEVLVARNNRAAADLSALPRRRSVEAPHARQS